MVVPRPVIKSCEGTLLQSVQLLDRVSHYLHTRQCTSCAGGRYSENISTIWCVCKKYNENGHLWNNVHKFVLLIHGLIIEFS